MAALSRVLRWICLWTLMMTVLAGPAWAQGRVRVNVDAVTYAVDPLRDPTMTWGSPELVSTVVTFFDADGIELGTVADFAANALVTVPAGSASARIQAVERIFLDSHPNNRGSLIVGSARFLVDVISPAGTVNRSFLRSNTTLHGDGYRGDFTIAVLDVTIPVGAQVGPPPIGTFAFGFRNTSLAIDPLQDPSYSTGPPTPSNPTATFLDVDFEPIGSEALFRDEPVDVPANTTFVEFNGSVYQFLDSHPNNRGSQIRGSVEFVLTYTPAGGEPQVTTYQRSNSTTHGDGYRGNFTLGSLSEFLVVEPTEIPEPVGDDRLIIVAGGGNYQSNAILNQTRDLANYAHRVARYRGYGAASIRYLSSLDTPDTNAHVDTVATSESIREAIQEWGAGADRLSVMLLDHGVFDAVTGQWRFLVDATTEDTLEATVLDGWLDELQDGPEGVYHVFLYVDMCYAGGFLRECSGAPGGRQRLVVTSTTDDRLASFGGSNGRLSFTSFFLSEALTGNSLYRCFTKSYENIVALRIPATLPQLPWLDDNGDAAATPDDGLLARGRFFGAEITIAPVVPTITAVSGEAILAAPAEVPVFMEVDATGADRAAAFLIYNREEHEDGEPIVNQVPVELLRIGATNRWEGSVSAADLEREGTYSVFFTAYRELPALDEVLELASDSRETRIVVGSGALLPDAFEEPDYGDHDPQTTQVFLSVGDPQSHTIHATNDEDWGLLYDYSETMLIEVSNYRVPPGAALQLALYRGGLDAAPLLMLPLTAADTEARSLSWLGAADLLYWKVSLCVDDSELGGCVPLEELNSECAYTITLRRTSGARNFIVAQLGDGITQLNWGSPGQGQKGVGPTFKLERATVNLFSNDLPDYQLVSSAIPVPAGACDLCVQYTDGPLPGGKYYAYRVTFQDGSTSTVWLEGLVSFVRGPAIVPTPLPTPTPTPRPNEPEVWRVQ